MSSSVERSESMRAGEIEEAAVDYLLDELNHLSASETEIETHLQLIDDGLLEIICDMLEIISSTSLRRHSALMRLKERAIPWIGDANRELVFERWQIEMELEAMRQLIVENKRKINEYLWTRHALATMSDASKTLRGT